MRKASAIQSESDQITTVEDLTGVFESIASTMVAKSKSKVELSKEFFQILWRRYTSIRVDPSSRITNPDKDDKNGKNVFVIVSAEAGLSGDIDQRLIEEMMKLYDAKTTDIIVLGSHGANQLIQRNIPYIRYFKVPESDNYVDVTPVIEAILPYSSIKVFYEEYVSLGVQGIKSIDLIYTIQSMGQEADKAEDIITDMDTIFEPSLEEIADQMEITMIRLAFSQAILESNLAQNASRFNAMAAAKKRAFELLKYYQLEFHRARRYEGDRRLREVMISIKRKKKAKKHS